MGTLSTPDFFLMIQLYINGVLYNKQDLKLVSKYLLPGTDTASVIMMMMMTILLIFVLFSF